MTTEEAIKQLIAMISMYNEGKCTTAIRTAIEALKKQIPKMVVYSGDGYADGEMVYDMADCPECGYSFDDGDSYWEISVCPKCHQSLKWSEEE